MNIRKFVTPIKVGDKCIVRITSDTKYYTVHPIHEFASNGTIITITKIYRDGITWYGFNNNEDFVIHEKDLVKI